MSRGLQPHENTSFENEMKSVLCALFAHLIRNISNETEFT